MTINQLASLIAKREGLKHEASVGDVREILKIIVELEFEDALNDPTGSGGPIFALVNAVQKYKPIKKKK